MNGVDIMDLYEDIFDLGDMLTDAGIPFQISAVKDILAFPDFANPTLTIIVSNQGLILHSCVNGSSYIVSMKQAYDSIVGVFRNGDYDGI